MKTFDLVVKSSANGGRVVPMNGGYLDSPSVCSDRDSIRTVVAGGVIYRYVGSCYEPDNRPYVEYIERAAK